MARKRKKKHKGRGGTPSRQPKLVLSRHANPLRFLIMLAIALVIFAIVTYDQLMPEEDAGPPTPAENAPAPGMPPSP